MRPALLPVLAAAGLAAGGLTACGGPSKEDAVKTASSWLDAVQSGNGAAACKLMSESATRGIAARYAKAAQGKPCPDVVAAYRSAVGADKLKAITAGGLEFEGDVKKDRLGVFPKAGAYQYEVVLMETNGDAWKVASSGIGSGRLTVTG